MASWTDHEPPCPVCRETRADKAGHIKHAAWCPHFMRGPDAGGDPYEWPSLLDAAPEQDDAGFADWLTRHGPGGTLTRKEP